MAGNTSFNQDLFYDSQLANNSLCWRLEILNSGSYTEILRGILSDLEFTYSINNEYAVDSDLDMISGAINKGMQAGRSLYYKGKQLGTMAGTVGKMFGNALGNGVGDALDSVGSAADGAIDWVSGAADNIAGKILDKGGLKSFSGLDLAHSKFVSAFEHAKFWGGSNVDISLPSLTTVIFDRDDMDLQDQIKELNGYFIQDIGTVEGSSNGIWGFMKAPNDYRPNFDSDNLDNPEFQGTFQLYLGTKYLIKNLVCTNFRVNLSQYKRIIPGEGSSYRLSKSPAYAQIEITLDLASFVTKATLANCFLQS